MDGTGEAFEIREVSNSDGDTQLEIDEAEEGQAEEDEGGVP